MPVSESNMMYIIYYKSLQMKMTKDPTMDVDDESKEDQMNEEEEEEVKTNLKQQNQRF